MEDRDIQTTHGILRATLNGKGSPAILLLHGNSFKRTIFKHILSSNLAQRHLLIAVDLPGHGDSSDATDPHKAYTQRGYADAMLQVLSLLEVKDVIVIGWSLGGHIAIEMVSSTLVIRNSSSGNNKTSTSTSIKGVMLIGTPPVNRGEVARAFTLGPGDSWREAYAARDDLSAAEQDAYAHVCADPPYEAWMTRAVQRCEQRARSIMFADFAAEAADDAAAEQQMEKEQQQQLWQRRTVETHDEVLWAVVNGSREPWIDLQFIRDIKFARLWKGRCVEMEGLLHAPFWARPQEFQVLLEEYVVDAAMPS